MMDKKVCAKATAVVPTNQPGGIYTEKKIDGNYTVIPVEILSVKFNPDCEEGDIGDKEMIEKGIKSLQEILVQHDINAPRGTSITLLFDHGCFGGIAHWPRMRKEGDIIRAEPYAVQVMYERPERQI